MGRSTRQVLGRSTSSATAWVTTEELHGAGSRSAFDGIDEALFRGAGRVQRLVEPSPRSRRASAIPARRSGPLPRRCPSRCCQASAPPHTAPVTPAVPQVAQLGSLAHAVLVTSNPAPARSAMYPAPLRRQAFTGLPSRPRRLASSNSIIVIEPHFAAPATGVPENERAATERRGAPRTSARAASEQPVARGCRQLRRRPSDPVADHVDHRLGGVADAEQSTPDGTKIARPATRVGGLRLRPGNAGRCSGPARSPGPRRAPGRRCRDRAGAAAEGASMQVRRTRSSAAPSARACAVRPASTAPEAATNRSIRSGSAEMVAGTTPSCGERLRRRRKWAPRPMGRAAGGPRGDPTGHRLRMRRVARQVAHPSRRRLGPERAPAPGVTGIQHRQPTLLGAGGGRPPRGDAPGPPLGRRERGHDPELLAAGPSSTSEESRLLPDDRPRQRVLETGQPQEPVGCGGCSRVRTARRI